MEGKISERIGQLVNYGVRNDLIGEEDRVFAVNGILAVMGLTEYEETGEPMAEEPLADILRDLTDDAVRRGICEDGIASRDLFDTHLMGVLMPRPSEVRKKFRELYAVSPMEATGYYYRLSCDSNYIRRDRIAKDVKWKKASPYGEIDITINLSKPEKDPKAIAAAKLAKQSGYPKCSLCRENEGYAGTLTSPARQNHRIIPVTLDGAEWFLQYSPYVYYNEHCIVFNKEHTPMAVSVSSFRRLLDFVAQFPHYFIGSNADLPIVGGSILAHDHFQGGCYTFAMAKAAVEREYRFRDFEDVKAGRVKWPMSCIRLSSPDRERLVSLAGRILDAWRGYTDKEAFIFAETDGEKHNTITPIARKNGADFELDLVLRNNITTEEHPLGVFHPHAELHHIKKENIGLIEVMGLAVLPARLKKEMHDLADAMLTGRDISADPALAKHAPWAKDVAMRHPEFSAENADGILREEIGTVFVRVLEDAGVFKRTEAGLSFFDCFIDSVNKA